MVIVGLDAFECIKNCMRLYQNTKGAFDISMRPLLELWTTFASPVHNPDDGELSQGMQRIGLPWLHIADKTHQISLMNKSIQIDLGGYGKGYAIDVLKMHLDEWDIKSGLIHSGRSTVSPFGKESIYPWSLLAYYVFYTALVPRPFSFFLTFLYYLGVI